ncbi:MAG: 2-amino-4-hydroxy-6-hydroxymethyldihydropteridine diphosphokinase [Nitrospirae bacterium]|nr:2-amino-4-hydroxy-6-hydroxymethyldihydropteridine diphosphokinase [Nitrospirota bacterium]MBF0535145.1 2-amino-4-hydroxy-6-hydroxymethyldihydropteridine diphosphokinase [Nitrospirota bacterium]MBF0615236.1 2-amino-4-hydroxy-6-hydroxymethyldihydropteridine diphosphokinase [Nitrospirota bacterium]
MQSFISIGSNIGDRKANCTRAVQLLNSNDIVVKAVSGMYETKPWGVTSQPDFINMCVEIETTLQPTELLAVLKEIEKIMGRKESARWGPRVIDLDIVFYGQEIINTQNLQIPHPHMHERDFVLIPLSELAPRMLHPVLNKTVEELLRQL